MQAQLQSADQLRITVVRNGFRVKALAFHLGLAVRTLERCFRAQLQTTPKIWIMRERMQLALPLLQEGFGNKQVAARLNYTRESNFCRDFKRYYGCAPQKFARAQPPPLSHFDNEMSRFEKPAALREGQTFGKSQQ